MKYVKILGLLAVAASAMMAFAANASATTVTGSGGTKTPTIHAISEESAVAGTKHVLLHNAIANIQCESTAQGAVEAAGEGGTGLTVKGAISSLTFSPCTNSWVVHVDTFGELEVHGESGNKGTLTSTGTKVTATRFGLQCVYKTNATDIGTVTGGASFATLDINATIPVVAAESSFLCTETPAKWTGAYKTTATLEIDQ